MTAGGVMNEPEFGTLRCDQDLEQIHADVASTRRREGAGRSPEAAELFLGSTSPWSPAEFRFELSASIARARYAARFDLDTDEPFSTADNQIDFRRFGAKAASQDSPALPSQKPRRETLANFSEFLRREGTAPKREARCESRGRRSQSFSNKPNGGDTSTRPGRSRSAWCRSI